MRRAVDQYEARRHTQAMLWASVLVGSIIAAFAMGAAAIVGAI